MEHRRKICFVIPTFNEESNISLLVEKLTCEINMQFDVEFIFVDDGSNDNTLFVLREMRQKDHRIHYISLSKNFGHQHAIKAGIDYADGDCIIMMDADLQHPSYLIPIMIKKWNDEGYDIVFTVRKDGDETSFFKRKTSRLFYRLMNSISDVKIEYGSADFRLIDKKISQIISSQNDPFLFLRGLVPWMGFRQFKIEYVPQKRHSGISKYSFLHMVRFAVNGITSFSIKPLRIATLIGTMISFVALSYGIYAIFVYFFNEKVISGWTSLLASMLFLGGIQLIMIGIIGEYVGKTYMHLKNRPTYIVRESTK